MDGIAVCVIVKNEEKFLEDCLNSVKNIADEIIVVDTGSTDRTIEIAGRFTDKIFDFEWKNDFSSARNFSISKASKRWILILDADEIISEKDAEKIKKLAYEDEADAYYFILRDYTPDIGVVGWKSSKGDDYGESRKSSGFTEDKILRFFKNNGYLFEGKIHETIQSSIKEMGGKIFMTDVVIHHFGNLREKKEIGEKKEKYSEMLKEKIESEDSNEKEEYYVLFELARELVLKNDFEAAKKVLEKSIELNPEYGTTLAMLGSICIFEKKFSEAEKLLKKAVVLESSNPDIHANLGVIYSEQGELNRAIKKFERALELNSKSADYNFNLCIVYLKLGKNGKARSFFEKAVELNPAYKDRIKFS